MKFVSKFNSLEMVRKFLNLLSTVLLVLIAIILTVYLVFALGFAGTIDKGWQIQIGIIACMIAVWWFTIKMSTEALRSNSPKS